MDKTVILAENTYLLIANYMLALFTCLLSILKLDTTTTGIVIRIIASILFFAYSIILLLAYNIEKKDLNVDKDHLKNIKLMMIAYFYITIVGLLNIGLISLQQLIAK